MAEVPFSRPSFVYTHKNYYMPHYSYNTLLNSSNFSAAEYLNATRNLYVKTEELKHSRHPRENEKKYSNSIGETNGFKKYYEKTYDKSIQNDYKKNYTIESSSETSISKPLLYKSSIIRSYPRYNYRKTLSPSENSTSKGEKDYSMMKPIVPPRPSLYERNNYEKVSALKSGSINRDELKYNCINKDITKYKDNLDNNTITTMKEHQNPQSSYDIKERIDKEVQSNESEECIKSNETTNNESGRIDKITSEKDENCSDLNFTSISCQEDKEPSSSDESLTLPSFDLANLKPVSTIERHARIIQWIHSSTEHSYLPPEEDFPYEELNNDNIDSEFKKILLT
uniref:Homeobox protein 2-like n=1 Tax=Parastrongyloides trichosuri TaxID=131310 RepID=A0A0N4ZII3_PARTI